MLYKPCLKPALGLVVNYYRFKATGQFKLDRLRIFNIRGPLFLASKPNWLQNVLQVHAGP